MAFLPAYNTGQVTLENGSSTVIGVGTAWDLALVTGGMLVIEAPGNAMGVATVVSDTEITSPVKWTGADGTYNYAILRETAEAVSNVWSSVKITQALVRASFGAIQPESRGPLSVRDALDLTADDDGYCHLYIEPAAEAPAFWFWDGVELEWYGPFPVQGGDGEPGGNGMNGAPAGILMTWDTGTSDADPGLGKIRADDADLASATVLYVDKANRGGSDIAAWLLGLDGGRITLTDPGTAKQAVFALGAVTDASGYVKLAVSGHSGETAIANDLPVSVQVTAGVTSTALLGVNAAADPATRLVVKSAAALLDAETDDVRLKINKAAAGDTASVLLQTGSSGRAELGLTGDDDWHVNVSADGAAWTEALKVDRTSGRVTLPAALALADPDQVATGAHLAAATEPLVANIEDGAGVAPGERLMALSMHAAVSLTRLTARVRTGTGSAQFLILVGGEVVAGPFVVADDEPLDEAVSIAVAQGDEVRHALLTADATVTWLVTQLDARA